MALNNLGIDVNMVLSYYMAIIASQMPPSYIHIYRCWCSPYHTADSMLSRL